MQSVHKDRCQAPCICNVLFPSKQQPEIENECVFSFTGGENGIQGDWGMCQGGIVNKIKNQDLVQYKISPAILWKPLCFRTFTSEHTWAEWFGLDCYAIQLRV